VRKSESIDVSFRKLVSETTAGKKVSARESVAVRVREVQSCRSGFEVVPWEIASQEMAK
jgi:hypothetical protein